MKLLFIVLAFSTYSFAQKITLQPTVRNTYVSLENIKDPVVNVRTDIKDGAGKLTGSKTSFILKADLIRHFPETTPVIEYRGRSKTDKQNLGIYEIHFRNAYNPNEPMKFGRSGSNGGDTKGDIEIPFEILVNVGNNIELSLHAQESVPRGPKALVSYRITLEANGNWKIEKI